MFHIVMINLFISAVAFTAFIILILKWKRAFKNDTKWVLLFLLVLIITHGIINVLEWSGIAPWIDQLGDLMETLEPLMWIFFFYVYLKEVDERRIMKRGRKYRELFESLKTAIVVHGPDGDILSANPAAEEAFGMKEEELKEQGLEDWIGTLYKENREPMSMDDFPVSKVFENREAFEGKMIGISLKDKKEINWYAISAVPYFNERGAIEKVIVSFDDITEAKKAEERKNFLNTMMRQDLGSKYNNIRGYLELMKEGEMSEEYLDKALESSRDINEILQMAKELNEIEDIDWASEKNINKILDHSLSDISDLIERKEIELDGNYHEKELKIRSNYSVRKLFIHLIRTRIQISDCEEIRVNIEEENDFVKVLIEDDGRELPREIKELFSGKIYEGKTSGEGGMLYYMIKEIVEYNDADIEVKDSEMGGARFDVRFKKAEE